MTDCIIVGGGVIGMLTALELADTGVAVTVVERGETGRESSWAGGGILSPLYPWRYPDSVTQLATWSQAHYQALGERLRVDSGIDPEWTRSGFLILETKEQGAARDWARRHRHQVEVVGEAHVSELEPALGKRVSEALWLPEVAQIRNPRLVKALRRSLLKRGVGIVEHAPVEGLLFKGDEVAGVVTASRERLEAQVVVVASGAWSARLLASHGVASVAVEPVRGQMLLFKGPPGLVRRIVLDHDRYLIPRRDGRVLMGSTVEHAGFDKSTTGAAAEELREIALSLVPALAECVVERHWAGLRPGSPLGVPFIGEHPEIRGLYINAGHFRNGVVLGPASARLLADLIAGRPPAVDPAPFRPR